jgi:hypothetical protein
VSFNHTFRNINDVLVINNHNFQTYVHLISLHKLEIKDKSGSYLDVLLNIDSNGRLTTTLYDKRDDFDFAIVNCPFLCSNIPLLPTYGVYISRDVYNRDKQLSLIPLLGPLIPAERGSTRETW